jgi:hypothetical protein
MAHFINLMDKRYNADQIDTYKPHYRGNDPIILITFLNGRTLDLNFDTVQARNDYIADMDRKLGVQHGK